MAATIRDWQAHGVDLRVELATSGSLIVGGNQTDIPFDSGGGSGAPFTWVAGQYPTPGSQLSDYNFTTASQVFSVSVKVLPGSRLSAGIWSGALTQGITLVPGHRYQVGFQVRQMDGKAASYWECDFLRSSDGGGSFSVFGSASGNAATDWEDVLITTGVCPAGFTMARFNLLGSYPVAGPAGLWGVQFRNLYVRQLDTDPPPIVWHDISCDVQGIGFRYGRERFTNRYDVSTMTLDLLNAEGQYSFHSPHPLGLRPGRQVRLIATYQGVDYPQAFHVIDSMTDTYGMDGRVVAHWSCVDPTTVLSDVDTATNSAPGVKTGGRIQLILDQIGYKPRLIDVGQWNVQPVTASGRSLRDEAGVTADSEGGNFFADRQGNVVYKDRTWLDVDPRLTEVQGNFMGAPHGETLPIVDALPDSADIATICVNELQTDWSLARVINQVSLANQGGVARTYEDEDSAKAYGPHSYQRHDFILADDPVKLDIRAADIMNGYAEPVLRVNTISFAPGMSDEWEFTLSVFLNWLVRVWYLNETNQWGYATCLHIQSIEHRITPRDWVTTLTVDLPESFTEIELALHGWDTGIWDTANWDDVT